MNVHGLGICGMGPRAAFMSILRSELSGLPAHMIEDMLGDFDRHFIDAAVAGRSDRQVAARLGDPILLAAELREDAARVTA